MTNDPPRSTASANSPDWEALARYLACESPATEAATVRGWLEEHPHDRCVIDGLDAAASGEQVEGDVDVEAALRAVHSRIAASPNGPAWGIEGGARRWRGRRVTVGAILVAAAAGIVAMLTVRRAPPAGTVAGSAVRTYATAVGRRDSITLADGSRVIIGPDSRLVVPQDYGVTARSVELRGDGYFDVHHDAAVPFAVHVGPAIIEDIGTRFAVESDAGDTTTVSVLAGSVRLRANDSPATSGAVLTAGDRGSLAAGGPVRAYRHAADADDAAWTAGRLVFRDASLVRVAGEIRRWYGVDIRIADSSLIHRHITNTFNGESIDQVLKIIGLTLGARVERHGDTVTIRSNGGAALTR